MLGAESDGGLHNNPVEGAQALGSLAAGRGGLHTIPVAEVLLTSSDQDYTVPEQVRNRVPRFPALRYG